MAAVTGVRLATASMRSKLNSFSTFLWSDSQIVLHWIHHLKLSTQSKPFIANRIQEIRNSLPVKHWTYVPTANNLADLLTRGSSMQQLRDSRLWLNGSSRLPSETHWPIWSPTNMFSVQTEETTDIVPPLVILNHPRAMDFTISLMYQLKVYNFICSTLLCQSPASI